MEFRELAFESMSGKKVHLSDFDKKYILIVNTASECGYTPQYADLEAVHKMMGDKLAIIGFPSNDFGGQEPGTNEQIAAFCEKIYAVSFEMAKKVKVVGNERHPIYEYLAKQTQKEPNWNFCKYLIHPSREKIEFYSSAVNPAELIEELN